MLAPVEGTTPALELSDLAPRDPKGPRSEGLASASVGGFLWTALAWGSNRIVILGLTILLARILTPSDFGVVTAALTLIAMLDAALDLGVGAAVVAAQQTGVTPQVRAAMSINILISTTIAIVGVACSGLLAQLFNAPDQSGIFALIFLYPFFRGLGQVSDAVLRRDLRFKERTVADATRAVVRAAVSIPLALTVGGAFSIAIGIVAAEVAASILLWSFARVTPALRFSLETVRGLLSFGGQVTLIRVFGSIRSSFDYLVVGASLGTVALGIYGMAYKLPELAIENVLWIFAGVALATYARAYTRGRDVLIAAMLRATRLLSLFGLVAGATLAVVARDAMPAIFSDTWTPAVVPMILISISLGVMSIAWASGDVFSAMGRPGILLVLDIPASILMIVGFLFSTQYGLIGVAAVHLVFNVLYCIARLIVLKRVTQVSGRQLTAAIVPAILVALIVAAVGFTVRAFVPEGTLLSTILLGLTCLATFCAVAPFVARPAIRDLIRLLKQRGAQRRSAAMVDA